MKMAPIDNNKSPPRNLPAERAFDSQCDLMIVTSVDHLFRKNSAHETDLIGERRFETGDSL